MKIKQLDRCKGCPSAVLILSSELYSITEFVQISPHLWKRHSMMHCV
ncbi:hypothetical protein WG66_009590 [Moniliophthora roreri]|nr:hypothetical protein WG66_009590 [Moniliophthora roreri]